MAVPAGPLASEPVLALASEERAVREAARQALVTMGAESVPALIECLRDERVRVRWEAAKALVDIAEPASAGALVGRLEDEDSGVRWLAAEGLIALERHGLPELLAALEHSAGSQRLREGAHHVIRGLPIWKLVQALGPLADALEHAAAESTVPVAAGSALEVLREERLVCWRSPRSLAAEEPPRWS
jgi:HEAT repeat protein